MQILNNFVQSLKINKLKKQNKIITLKGIEPNAILINDFENLLNKFFVESIYKPLAKNLKTLYLITAQKQVLNSKQSLIDYILNNQIVFDGIGFIYTRPEYVNTNITIELQNLGAIYDKNNKRWNVAQLPENVSQAIIQMQNLQQNTNLLLNQTITNVTLNQQRLLNEFREQFSIQYNKIIQNAIQQTKKTFSADDITIDLKFDNKTQQKIVDNYIDNLDLYINNFTNTQITELRQIIYNNVTQGLRKENLISQIQDRFSVSKSKAEFLARQETALATSKIQSENMLRAGLEYYMWDSARDNKVRKQHKHLNDKIFHLNEPGPIVDVKTGRRAHAGEDFNCRCTKRPIVVDTERLKPFYENGYTYYKIV
jgi:SPP1 gp7 family putative phage head morphogenesis protein